MLRLLRHARIKHLTSSPLCANMSSAAAPASDAGGGCAEDADVEGNLARTLERLSAAHNAAPEGVRSADPPRLVAVSKTKPKEMVIRAYNAGQRHFGENYIQELFDKSSDPELQSSCPDIQWRFIGTCQSNKAAKLAKCANLFAVETVTGAKLADKLQAQWSKEKNNRRLDVMIQVNTSGEANKNGVEPGDAPDVAAHIAAKCPDLRVSGLMTIGALGHSLASAERAANCAAGQNPDFLALIAARKAVAARIGVAETALELSMGMSGDFEEAVRMGSNSVRVGSSIFGARNYGGAKKAEAATEAVVEKMKDAKIA